MPANNNGTYEIWREYIRELNYWHSRFDESRDVDHLDNAERHAVVVRLYLPRWLQGLDVTDLRNIFGDLSTKQVTTTHKDGTT